MSCDNNGRHAVRSLLASGSPTAAGVLAAFGGDADAAFEGLMRIVETARAQASQAHMLAHNDPKKHLYWNAQQTLATTRMARLFQRWKQELGPSFREPAHGPVSPTYGVRIPRDKAAHHGWAALEQTLGYFGGRERQLPAVAQQVIDGSERRRLESTSVDVYGRFRCRNCGRFASQTAAHICPQTAGPQEMAAALQRKLQTPLSAYHPHHAFAAMMHEALDTGVVRMTHPLTGEAIDATLDGVLVAIQQGFIPERWRTPLAEHELVTLPDGRVVPVLDAEGLTAYIPSEDPITATAGAYGTTRLATLLPARPVLTPVLAMAGSSASSGSALPVLERSIDEPNLVLASKPERYDIGRLNGHFFMKRAALGKVIEIDGETFKVGAHSSDPDHHGRARATGLASATSSVTIGNSIVEAVALLRDAQIVNDPASQAIELYSSDASALIGFAIPAGAGGACQLITPAIGMGGDGRMTVPKLASIIAQHAANPVTALDHALAEDLAEYRAGRRHALAVADAAYLSLNAALKTSMTSVANPYIATSVQLDALRCPDCGQFMGTLHNCPARRGYVPAVAATAAEPLPFELTPGPAEPAVPDAAPEPVNPEPDPVPVPADPAVAGVEALIQGMARVLDRVISRLDGINPAAAEVPSLTDELVLTRGATPTIARTPRRADTLTPQEHILRAVQPPEDAIDPYLRGIPRAVGGDLDAPLPVDIPPIDANFAINESTERALRLMASSLQIAWSPENAAPRKDMRSFALYGPPGTGKNTTARQLAATLGLPYTEVTINPDTSAQEEIGTTVLQHGSTRAQLGRLGYAAAMGQVICVNEIVRNPKLATAFQSMIEDGEIELQGTEGGKTKVPVHPNTVFVFTWNPGNEGDAERMAMAPLSRTLAIPLDPPTVEEQAQRLLADVERAQGRTVARAAEAAAIFRRDYHNQPVEANPARATAVARFMDGMQKLAANGQIAVSGDNTVVGPRETKRLYYLLEATRDPQLALESLKIYCDQDPAMFASQWRAVKQLFNDVFGADGGVGLYRK